jgi:Trk K+ transport system NAD-binding subunit
MVARANDLDAVTPLYLAGAEAVVPVSEIGGAALARLVIPSGLRLPAVSDLVLVEAPVPPTLVGRSLRRANLARRTGLLCLAVRAPGAAFEVNPPETRRLTGGERLLLFGTEEAVWKFAAKYGVKPESLL